MKKTQHYSIVKKSEVKKDKVAVILAVVSAAAFVFCIVVSALAKGEGSTYIGAVGLAAALLALYGCVISMKGMFERGRGNKLSYIGAVSGGIMFILWIAVFITGIKG